MKRRCIPAPRWCSVANCGNWQGFTSAGSTWDDFNECGTAPSVIGAIPDQVNDVNDVGGFDVSQYFAEGDGNTPIYTATGLPAGATITEAGFINYDLTTFVTTDVNVTLSTGINPVAGDTFNWVVNAVSLVDGWATESGDDWLTEDGFRWILE
jgi:hypothetical protein